MNPDILVRVEADGAEEALPAAWSVAILVDGQPTCSAAGTCAHATEREMEETAYLIGLRWIADHFPGAAVSMTIDGEQFAEAAASAHLDRLSTPQFAAADQIWPVLMKPQDIIPMKTAIDVTGKADRTLRGWCREHGISRQSSASAPLEISRPALEMVMHGDMVALELLRAGERTAPRVARYFRHLGIEP